MRQYSQLGLLSEEIESDYKNASLIKRAIYRFSKQSNVVLYLQVPKSMYVRAEIFCEDVSELSGSAFNQSDLLNILWNDFMLYAKKNPNPQKIYSLLLELEKKPTQVYFYNIGNVTYTTNEELMADIYLSIKRKIALRGEVLLADISEIYPRHGFTVEKVFELLYFDFIDKTKKGENQDVINEILKLLDDEESSLK